MFAKPYPRETFLSTSPTYLQVGLEHESDSGAGVDRPLDPHVEPLEVPELESGDEQRLLHDQQRQADHRAEAEGALESAIVVLCLAK